MPGHVFEVPDPPEEDDVEPIWFDLKGHHRRNRDDDGKPIAWTEHFDVAPNIPFALLQDLASTITINDAGEQLYSKHAVLRFMRAVIEPDQRGRWDELVRDVDRPVDLEMVTTIMQWIVGAQTHRPTGPQSSSRAGSAAMNGGSKASSGPKDVRKKTGKGGTERRGST